MLKIFKKYNIGLINAVKIIKMLVIMLESLLPFIIGNVLAFSNLSPSISSISFVISRARVMKNAKNPIITPVSNIVLEFVSRDNMSPPRTKHNAVNKETLIFPIKGIALRYLA